MVQHSVYEGVKSCRHYPVCAVTEGFSGEGPVSSLRLTMLHTLFLQPGTLCSTQNTAHTVWSVTWWNVEHYASSTVYESLLGSTIYSTPYHHTTHHVHAEKATRLVALLAVGTPCSLISPVAWPPQCRGVGYGVTASESLSCIGHKILHLHSVISRWPACVALSVLNTEKCASIYKR